MSNRLKDIHFGDSDFHLAGMLPDAIETVLPDTEKALAAYRKFREGVVALPGYSEGVPKPNAGDYHTHAERYNDELFALVGLGREEEAIAKIREIVAYYISILDDANVWSGRSRSEAVKLVDSRVEHAIRESSVAFPRAACGFAVEFVAAFRIVTDDLANIAAAMVTTEPGSEKRKAALAQAKRKFIAAPSWFSLLASVNGLAEKL